MSTPRSPTAADARRGVLRGSAARSRFVGEDAGQTDWLGIRALRGRAGVSPRRHRRATRLVLGLAGGLLVAFALVVHQGLERGRELRAESQALADAASQCGRSKGSAARAACLAEQAALRHAGRPTSR